MYNSKAFSFDTCTGPSKPGGKEIPIALLYGAWLERMLQQKAVRVLMDVLIKNLKVHTFVM